MTSIGVLEAETRLSALLDEVEAGGEVVITRYGRPAARLVAAQAFDGECAHQAARELREMRKTLTLGGLSWKELRDEGRR